MYSSRRCLYLSSRCCSASVISRLAVPGPPADHLTGVQSGDLLGELVILFDGLMGHASLETTTRLYTRPSAADMQRAVGPADRGWGSDDGQW
jgi:hypothetical protein